MASIVELKNIIVDLKVELAKSRIPHGHCPYAYYSIERDGNEGCDNCVECEREFSNKIREMYEMEVSGL